MNKEIAELWRQEPDFRHVAEHLGPESETQRLVRHVKQVLAQAQDYSSVGQSLSTHLVEVLNSAQEGLHGHNPREIVAQIDCLLQKQDFQESLLLSRVKAAMSWAHNSHQHLGTEFANPNNTPSSYQFFFNAQVNHHRQAERMLLLTKMTVHEIMGEGADNPAAKRSIEALALDILNFSDHQEMNYRALSEASQVLVIAMLVCSAFYLGVSVGLLAYAASTTLGSTFAVSVIETSLLYFNLSATFGAVAAISAIPAVAVSLRDQYLNHQHDNVVDQLNDVIKSDAKPMQKITENIDGDPDSPGMII